MSKLKRIITICVVSLFVCISSIVGVLIFSDIFGNNANNTGDGFNKNYWDKLGVHFATAEEETGASTAAREMKGGAVYVGKGLTMVVDEATFSNHEGYYGGAFYVANGGKLYISGGTIECNGAMYGGAIYIEYGGYVEISGGEIKNNCAENGPAIWAEGKPESEGGGENFNAVHFTDTSLSAAIVKQNQYADFGKFYINYYVDGELKNYSEQKIAAFMGTEVPVDDDNCCGWFLDENLTQPIEKGQVLEYTQGSEEVVLQSATSSFYKTVSLYTKAATKDSFNYTLQDGTYIVSGNTQALTTLVMPKTYQGVNVTGIGSYQNNKNVKNFYINSNVIQINNNTFYSANIEKLNFTNNLKIIGQAAFRFSKINEVFFNKEAALDKMMMSAFQNCTNLERVTLPYALSQMEFGVFHSCSMLSDIKVYSMNLPKSMDSALLFLGAGSAVEECKVVFGKEITRIPANFMNKSYVTHVEGESIIEVGNAAFQDCTKLKVLNLKVVEIFGANSFRSSGIEELILPSTLKHIGDNCFYNSSVTSITFENDTISNDLEFAYGSFNSCTNLKTLTIPSTQQSVTIGGHSFRFCNIESLELNSGVVSVKTYAFDSNPLKRLVINSDENTSQNFSITFESYSLPKSYTYLELNTYNVPSICSGHNSLETLVLNENVKDIPNGAFKDCVALSTVTIKGSNVSVGSEAFKNCVALTALELEKFASVGTYCFQNTGLVVVDIPETIGNSKLPDGLFADCNSLNKVTMLGNLPNGVKLGKYVFLNCSAFEKIDFESKASWQYVTALDVGSFKNSGVRIIQTRYCDIPDYAYYGCKNLQDGFAEERNVGSYGFAYSSIKYVHLTFNAGGSFGASAFEGCTELTEFQFSSHEINLTIPRFAFKGCTKLSEVDIPHGEQNSYTTIISESAFEGCSSLINLDLELVEVFAANAFKNAGLTEVTFGENVTSIDPTAFKDCGIQHVQFFMPTVPAGILNSETLELVYIGETVTNIETAAFNSFKKLSSIYYYGSIPKTATHGSSNIFYQAGKEVDTTFYIGENVTIIPNYFCSSSCMNEIVSYAENDVEIGAYSFNCCKELESVDFNNIVTTGIHSFRETNISFDKISNMNKLSNLGNYTFHNCLALTSFECPASLTRIGESAFDRCEYITSLTLNEGLLEIGAGAFAWTNVTSITFPASVTTLGHSASSTALGIMNSLKEVNVADGNTVYSAVNNCLIETATKTMISGCRTSVIPTDSNIVTSIRWRAFFRIQGLGEETVNLDSNGYFVIPSNITSFVTKDGDSDGVSEIFYNCFNIKKIKIEAPLTRIPKSCFAGCVGLEDIVLPETIKSIGEKAFNYCISLSSITIPASCERIEVNAFINCTSMVDTNSYKELNADGQVVSITRDYNGTGLISINFVIDYCWSEDGETQFPKKWYMMVANEDGSLDQVILTDMSAEEAAAFILEHADTEIQAMY